jgi:hypothetical protein
VLQEGTKDKFRDILFDVADKKQVKAVDKKKKK